MFDQQVSKRILRRLTEVRTMVLGRYPFFGGLLMRLRLGLAECETAFTDMKRIVFDPAFVDRLDDEEIMFVMLHEVMHCALDHCYRAKNFQHLVFNVACDIVVNSNIMEVMGVAEFEIDGGKVMHLAPDGTKGVEHTAEDVYFMLMNQYKNCDSDIKIDVFHLPDVPGGKADTHEPWRTMPTDPMMQKEWKSRIIEAEAKNSGKGETPAALRKLLEEFHYQSKLNWKDLFRQFIQLHHEEYDYTFSPPDRRYIEFDIWAQSFRVIETEIVEDIWFCIDTSGSVSQEKLNKFYAEIKAAVEQYRGLAGKLSFFDTSVTEPKEFSSVEELCEIQAVGGGGTDFHAIFKYMEEHMMQDLPLGIVILTDGYAQFPEEEAAYGVPVLWIIMDTNRQPPWGMCVHVRSNENDV